MEKSYFWQNFHQKVLSCNTGKSVRSQWSPCLAEQRRKLETCFGRKIPGGLKDDMMWFEVITFTSLVWSGCQMRFYHNSSRATQHSAFLQSSNSSVQGPHYNVHGRAIPFWILRGWNGMESKNENVAQGGPRNINMEWRGECSTHFCSSSNGGSGSNHMQVKAVEEAL